MSNRTYQRLREFANDAVIPMQVHDIKVMLSTALLRGIGIGALMGFLTAWWVL